MQSDIATELSDAKETGRLEAFSDGVFGIAMTLLVLELKVPQLPIDAQHPTAHALLRELLHQWPGYFAFLTSFFTVLLMWVHHHALFRLVQKTDATLLFANGVLLLVVTAVPFPTAVLAKYLMTPAARAACGFYAVTFVLVAAAFHGVMLAAFRPRVVSKSASPAMLRRFRRSYRLGPAMYLVALALSVVNIWLCLACHTALWIFWASVTHDMVATD